MGWRRRASAAGRGLRWWWKAFSDAGESQGTALPDWAMVSRIEPRLACPEPSNYSERCTVYVCRTCCTQTGFEWSDFDKHIGSRFSNLMYPDRQAVEREVADKLTDENSFLDFYCSGCNGVVRVYYRYEPPEGEFIPEGSS